VQPDPQKGTIAVFAVTPGAGERRDEIEKRIRERMQYYATPYEIRWDETVATSERATAKSPP